MPLALNAELLGTGDENFSGHTNQSSFVQNAHRDVLATGVSVLLEAMVL